MSAQSIDVKADIPEGIILVQGKASPNALVKLYENGNDQPTASVVADSNGDFSEELPQMNTGVVDIGIRAQDTNGMMTILISKQVAIISQQTSTLTVTLPPTIKVQPETAPFGVGTMEFSGRTVPGATVKVTIEPSTVLSITADSQGNYLIPLLVKSLPSVGVYTFGVEVTAGSEVSDYVIAGTFVITPPVQPPVVLPESPIQEFIERFVSKPLSPPSITSPLEDEYTSSSPFVMSGQAQPGTEVEIYDEGKLIGVVLSGQDGRWQFYFSPHKETHTIYARSCINGKCSSNSRSVTIKRPDTQSVICKPGIELKSYRISATAGSSVDLAGTSLVDTEGAAYISWGDNSDERFDLPQNKDLHASHNYDEAGTYSGYVIVSASETCQTVTYFTAEITNTSIPLATIHLIVAGIIGIIAIAWLALHFIPALKP